VKNLQDHFRSAGKETAGTSVGAPQTRADPKQIQHEKEAKPDHTDKWKSCVKDVKKKGKVDSPYAVCTANLGPSIKASAKKETNANPMPTKQKQAKKENTKDLRFIGRFKEVKESGAQPEGRRFRVVLLQEGMGNLADCFYYTPAALQSAIPLYEGSQFFINHPAKTEEQDRPERDVRDVAGYFENVDTEIDKNGVTNLCGDLVLINGPAYERERALIMESLSYELKHPDKELVGLSINASGDFQTMGIEQFMNEQPVPDACKPKLLEALQNGITMMRPVQEIDSAVSCDLVTTAGAGGKILQLLEGGKKMPKQEEAKQEEKSKEAAGGTVGAEPGKEAGSDGAADGQDGSHPDAQQDEQLIQSMMKKYLGDGFSDEDKSMAHEAYKNAMEMGLDHSEAMKCAGYHMKMAKHVQMKQAKQEEAGAGDGAQPGGNPKGVANPPSGGGGMDGKMSQEKGVATDFGESNKKTDVVRLAGEVARLQEQLNAINLEKHVDKTLRESRLPMNVTKKFREAIKGVKSVKEVNDKFNLFREAYGLGGEATGGFILGAEKTGEVGEAAISFADCAE
jgi:hypothetical protein